MEPIGVYLTIQGLIGLVSLVTSVSVGGYAGFKLGIKTLDKIESLKAKHANKLIARELTITSETK